MSGPPRGANGMGVLPAWADLESAVPQITATMRRYLTQIGCVLRPRSVDNADHGPAHASPAFLTETAPEVTQHRAGDPPRTSRTTSRGSPRGPARTSRRLTTATIAHRLGTLRMFFVRLDEWSWDEAPPRVPMFPGDLPRQDHPLPKALDDASAAKLLRAAQDDQRMLVRGHRGDAAAHRAARQRVHQPAR